MRAMKSLEEYAQRINEIRSQRTKLNERWPEEVREGARLLCDMGFSRKQIAEATGLAPSLIGGWVVQNVKPKSVELNNESSFKQVKIVRVKKENIAQKFTLHSSRGFFVEGLDENSLISILGKLL